MLKKCIAAILVIISLWLTATLLTKEPVVKPQVKQVIPTTVIKTEPQVNTSESIQEFVPVRTMRMEATAYCLTTPTATGTIPAVGTVAVDPKVIPLYTKLYVVGYGDAVALDTGGDIKGNRIDLWFATEQEAISFGRRMITVIIKE